MKDDDNKKFEWAPEPPSYNETVKAGLHIARSAKAWRTLAILGWVCFLALTIKNLLT